MKVLQKHIKRLFVFIAFLACSFMFALTPLKLIPTGVAAAEDWESGKTPTATFNSVKMPKKVDYSKDSNAELKIPYLKDESGEYYIRVVDQGGFVRDFKVKDKKSDTEFNTDTTFFQADDENNAVKILDKTTNTYNIYYIKIDSQNNTTYFSKDYKVEVIGAKYVIEQKQIDYADGKYTETNLNVLFPTMASLNSTFTVPKLYGYQTVEDGKEKKFEEVPFTISYGGVEIYNSENGTTQEGSAYNKDTRVLTFKDEDKYVITYTYKEATPVQKEITVDKDFVAPTADNIDIKTPTPPTAKLGDKNVVLRNPQVDYNLQNFSQTDVAKNVIKIEIYQEDNPEIKQTLTNNNFTFNFTTGDDGFGNHTYQELEGKNYKVKYTIQDYFSQTPIEKVYDLGYFSRNNINPTVKAVYDYTIFDGNGNFVATDEGENAVKSAVAEIKAEYNYTKDSGLVFPAVYFNSPVDDYTDLMVVRYFTEKESGTKYYIDGVKIDYANDKYVAVTENDGYNFVYDAENKPIEANDAESQKKYFEQLAKSATFKFAKDGAEVPNGILDKEYRLCYEVKVKSTYQSSSQTYTRRNALYEQSSTEYSFKIVSSDAKDTNLSINIVNNNNPTVYEGEKVSFTVNSNDDVDLRLVNAMYYSDKDFSTIQIDEVINEAKKVKGNTDSIINLLTDALKTKLNGATNVYKFDLVDGSTTKFETTIPENVSKGEDGKIYVLALTINDDGVVKFDTTSLYIADEQDSDVPTINSVQYESNEHKQIFENDSSDTTPVGQGVDVKIPIVQFSDVKDKNLSTSVFYYIIPEGDISTDVKDLTFHKNYKYLDEYSIYKGKVSGHITTTAVGTYVVVYTATDDAGNTTVAHYSFKVVSTAQPLLDVYVNCEGSGSSYTATVGDILQITPHVYDGNDNSKEIVDDENLNIEIVPTKVQGKHYEEVNGGWQLFTAGRYTFEVNVSWTDETKDKGVHVIPPYEITVTVEAQHATDGTASIVWDEDFNLPKYFSYTAANEEKQLIIPQWVATQEGYNVSETKLLYKRQNATSWSEATRDASGKNWVIKTSGIGVYNISYETYTDAPSNYYDHKELTITYGDNIPPKFRVNAGALQDKITYTDSDINIAVKFSTIDKIMTITATQDNKNLYTWTSYTNSNNKKDNVNFKIVENTEDPAQGERDNYSWSSLTIKLVDSEDNEVSKTSTIEDGFTVYNYTISSIGTYRFVFTAEDNQQNKSDPYEIKFSVTAKAEPTSLSNSKIGIILIVVSSIILIGVIMFFLFTGKSSKKQKPAALTSETTSKKPAKKSASKSKKADDKAEKVEEPADKDNADNQDADKQD